MAAGNIADRHSGLHRLGNHGQLQIGGETPPASDAGDHFDLRERIGHRRMLRCLIPGFDGALFSPAWREALWARFFMAAPRRQRRSVERGTVRNFVRGWAVEHDQAMALVKRSPKRTANWAF